MLRLATLAGLLASAGAFAVPGAPGMFARAPRAGFAHTRRGVFGASMSSFVPVEPGFNDRSANAYQPDMPSLQNPIILTDSVTKVPSRARHPFSVAQNLGPAAVRMPVL